MIAPRGLVPAWLVQRFSRLTGCRVQLTQVAEADLPERVAIDLGRTLDVALVRSSASLGLIRAGAVAPLSTDLLEHRDELLGPLRDPPATTVDGRRYGLAHQWGVDVLVAPPSSGPTPNSLATLLDPRYRGEVAMPDDPLTLADAALLNGVADPYSLSAAELEGASSVLESQQPLLGGRFTTADGLAALLRGGVEVALAGSTIAAGLAREGLTVRTTVPREGTTGWFESWQITAETRHPVCAYQWLNLATSPEVQAALGHDGLAPAVADACTLPGPGRCERLGLATPDTIDAVAFARTPLAPTTLEDWRGAWAVCCAP